MTARRSRSSMGWLLALVVFGLVAWRLVVLQRPGGVVGAGCVAEQVLFEHALRRGLLVPADNRELHVLPPDELLARCQRGETVAADDERLFAQIDYSPAGRRLRSELQRWNRSRAPVAIRDNSAAFPGVSHDGWSAYRCDGGRLALGGVVPEDYGFLHQGRLRTGFGPWQVAGGSDCVEFRTRFFSAKPYAVSLWLVGALEDGSAATPIGPEDFPEPQACDPRPVEPQAGILVLDQAGWQSVGANAWQREVSVRVRPVAFHGLRVAGLHIAIDPEDCGFVWLDEVQGRRPDPIRRGPVAALSTADGITLLDDDGRPTPEVRKLGLLPLVGYGPDDVHSLAGLLARSKLPVTGFATRLTLDSRIQAVAHEELRAGVEGLFPTADALFGDKRRAALVVMNGRGAILAAAGLPGIPEHGRLLDWDLAAFAHSYPLTDPLRVRAWDAVLDKYEAPGATLEPATALAAFDAIVDQTAADPKLAGMLQGWDPETFVKETGLTLNSRSYDPYAGIPTGSPDGQQRELSNSGEGPASVLGLPADERLQAQECRVPVQVDQNPGDRIGLATAMRDAFDIWFARLALMVDGPVMAKLDHKVRPETPARFTQTLRRLGFADTLDLLAQAPGFIDPSERPRLPAAKVGLWAADPRPARWRLALNAIGQGVSVAPLQMARLAASIATGAVVRPYLVADWNGDAVSVDPGPALAGDLGLLRTGMQAVVQVGDARKAFAQVFAGRLDSPLRCNTYAQTGTGQLEAGLSAGQRSRGVLSISSAWFVGWYQPDAGEPLVFACMVSHAHGRDSRTGGQVCAPIVARLLDRLYPDAGGSVSTNEFGQEVRASGSEPAAAAVSGALLKASSQAVSGLVPEAVSEQGPARLDEQAGSESSAVDVKPIAAEAEQ